jgi:polysaccharide biosynthesis transport protein
MSVIKGKEYSLSEIFFLIAKRFWIILLCVAIGAAGGYAFSKYVVAAEYTASVSMYVVPNQGDAGAVPTLSELNYAQQIVVTYIEILKTASFMEDVATLSRLDYSASSLKQMVQIDVVNNTEIFKVQVTSTVPEHSLRLASTIASLAPQKIKDTLGTGSVKVIDEAVMPVYPSAPNVPINTIIGGFLAAVLAVLIIVFLDMKPSKQKK